MEVDKITNSKPKIYVLEDCENSTVADTLSLQICTWQRTSQNPRVQRLEEPDQPHSSCPQKSVGMKKPFGFMVPRPVRRSPAGSLGVNLRGGVVVGAGAELAAVVAVQVPLTLEG